MSHRQPGQEPGTRWPVAAFRAFLLLLASVHVWAAATTTSTPLRIAAYTAAAAVILAELARATLT
ncbi:hypothetical protein ABT352_33160 [Streptosporangium sp. NPDC000563]|uniref:hypothetical protein n=1 Tax=Streptosporangium sp. NPDC000563 TaxID=3154366 RepID=UPI00332FA2EA